MPNHANIRIQPAAGPNHHTPKTARGIGMVEYAVVVSVLVLAVMATANSTIMKDSVRNVFLQNTNPSEPTSNVVRSFGRM